MQLEAPPPLLRNDHKCGVVEQDPELEINYEVQQ